LKYPLSHNLGLSVPDKFAEIMKFHFPPNPETIILDPTCGKRYIWETILRNASVPYYDLNGDKIKGFPWNIVFSDIEDFGYNTVSDVLDLKLPYLGNGIIYDPPYFFDSEVTSEKDDRRDDYGNYGQSYESLIWFMDVANNRFPKLLTEDGKLILKCSDQYNVKDRTFYPLHITWINHLTNFELIDLYVCLYHKLTPTAFQVKDRPCSVIMHTYFLVFKRR
jgi:hypothetical protein